MTTVAGNLTILADNSVPGKSDLLAEHGFSAYLETGAGKYLFDTGKGKTIVHNANLCQIDLSTIAAIVLSHGHGDHTGGLPEALNFKSEVPVWAHPDIFIERFRLDAKGRKKYSGVPFQRGFLGTGETILPWVSAECDRWGCSSEYPAGHRSVHTRIQRPDPG